MSLTLAQVRNRVRRGIRATTSQYGDEEIDADINEVISGARDDRMFVPVQDETLVQASETYEYPLTGSTDLTLITYVTDLYPETIEAGIFERQAISKYLWEIEPASTPYIHFSMADWYADDGKKLRLIGMKPQAAVTAETDVIYLPESYVVMKSRAKAHNNLSSGAGGSRSNWHGQQVAICEQYAEISRMSAYEFKIPPHSRMVKGRF